MGDSGRTEWREEDANPATGERLWKAQVAPGVSIQVSERCSQFADGFAPSVFGPDGAWHGNWADTLDAAQQAAEAYVRDRAELARLRVVAAALVAAAPPCDGCGAPSTRYRRAGGSWCDAHAPEGAAAYWGADTLRMAVALAPGPGARRGGEDGRDGR